MDRQTTERNIRYLVVEIFWAAIYMGCLAFNAAYLIRLGGSNLHVSLLTSAGALVNAVATMPFAAFLERQPRRRPWLIGSILAVRLGHVGMILIPWLFEHYGPEAMLALVMLLNVPIALFMSAFLAMLADIVPIDRRARVFATRNIVLGGTVAVTTFLMGRWLDMAPFPFNYQLLYALAVVTGSFNALYVSRLVLPEHPPAPHPSLAKLNLRALRDLAARQRPFVNIVINTLVFNLAFWMAMPLQPIYFVRELGASDGWLGLWLGVVSGSTILGNLLWRRLIDRHSFGWALVRSTALSSIYFFLIGLFPDLNLILLFALLAGLVNPGVELSHLSTLMGVCPPERRTLYMSIFTTVMNIGFFLAPLAVAPLTALLGARGLVLLLGALRLLGAALFALNPVEPSGSKV